MEYKMNNYNLNSNENIFYIFQIKIKTINNIKYIIKRVKQEKHGTLINELDEIEKISSLKIDIYDLNDPTNGILIKKNIINDNNIIIKNKNVLIHVNNDNYTTINYKFLN